MCIHIMIIQTYYTVVHYCMHLQQVQPHCIRSVACASMSLALTADRHTTAKTTGPILLTGALIITMQD